MSENPYAAPQDLQPSPAAPPTDAHAIRQAHLGTEASIKSLGFLYYLGGFLSLLGIATPVAILASSDKPLGAGDLGAIIGQALISLFIAIPLIIVARALRRFRPWAKIPVAILSVIGLLISLANPLGLLVSAIINIYILFLVLGKKGRVVLSGSYQEIIDATPDVRHKTSWIFVGCCLFVVLLLILGAFFTASAGR